MNRKNIFCEAFLMIVILQTLRILIEKLVNPFLPDTSFAERMATMFVMLLLSVAVVLYARLKKTPLSVFPAHFGKLCIIATVAATLIFISSPSNYTDTIHAVPLLIYGSIVTPVFEELIFRGYLWNRLNTVLSKEIYTYIWSVVLFSVWHLGYMIPQLLAGNFFAVLTKLAAGAVYGIVLGFVRMKCKNCYLTMLLHGVMNVFMI